MGKGRAQDTSWDAHICILSSLKHYVNSKGQTSKFLEYCLELRIKTPPTWIQLLISGDERSGTKHEESVFKDKLKQNKKAQKEPMLVKHRFGSGMYNSIHDIVYILQMWKLTLRETTFPTLPNGPHASWGLDLFAVVLGFVFLCLFLFYVNT